MYDIHGVEVSHQTIANYCDAVAPRIKLFVDHFTSCSLNKNQINKYAIENINLQITIIVL